VRAERERMQPEDKRHQVVSIKADRKADMKTINAVKQALRRAKVYNINYSAARENSETNRETPAATK